MPIYDYECQICMFIFDEIFRMNEKSGKAWCPKCGNTAFKIPSISAPQIFKPRVFADGTETPNNVRTFEQEEKWKKKEGITYDTPTGKEGRHRAEERKIKSKTALELAFRDALQKPGKGIKEQIMKETHDKAK